MSYPLDLPKDAELIGPGIAYNLGACREDNHVHNKECVWIWHDCQLILGPNTIAPGDKFGWRPSGIMGHDFISLAPLSVSPSVYWPDCCGKHGFITDGVYTDV